MHALTEIKISVARINAKLYECEISDNSKDELISLIAYTQSRIEELEDKLEDIQADTFKLANRLSR
jgi:oligoribonuclease NrnB/cAMP/cGMP phosphodiesterase (DHH superfamily)